MIVNIRQKDELNEFKQEIAELIFDTQKDDLKSAIKEKSIDHIKKDLVGFIKLRLERWFLEGAKFKLFGQDDRLTGILIYKEDYGSCRIIQMNSRLVYNYPLLWFYKKLCTDYTKVEGDTTEYNRVLNKYSKKINVKMTKRKDGLNHIERSNTNG